MLISERLPFYFQTVFCINGSQIGLTFSSLLFSLRPPEAVHRPQAMENPLIKGLYSTEKRKTVV